MVKSHGRNPISGMSVASFGNPLRNQLDWSIGKASSMKSATFGRNTDANSANRETAGLHFQIRSTHRGCKIDTFESAFSAHKWSLIMSTMKTIKSARKVSYCARLDPKKRQSNTMDRQNRINRRLEPTFAAHKMRPIPPPLARITSTQTHRKTLEY